MCAVSGLTSQNLSSLGVTKIEFLSSQLQYVLTSIKLKTFVDTKDRRSNLQRRGVERSDNRQGQVGEVDQRIKLHEVRRPTVLQEMKKKINKYFTEMLVGVCTIITFYCIVTYYMYHTGAMETSYDYSRLDKTKNKEETTF